MVDHNEMYIFLLISLFIYISRTDRYSAECQKIKNGELDQYGTKPFEQQQFRTAGAEGVKTPLGLKGLSGHCTNDRSVSRSAIKTSFQILRRSNII